MKNFKWLYIFIIGFVTVSCDDGFLTETVRSDVSYSHYETREGIESGIAATYDQLREIYRTSFNSEIQQTGVDTYRHGRDAYSQRELDHYEATLNASFWRFHGEYWEYYYDGINRANIVLDAIEEIGDDEMPADLKMIRSAELRFLRGYYYYLLVHQFGEIPLVTSTEFDVKTDFSRASVAEVYNFIISDLTFAVENLPLTQNEYGRATKGAAQHALAKIYLTRGSAVNDQRGQQPSDIENAAAYADEVIFSGQYELVPDFAQLWDINNQKNSEIIFAVQFSETELYNNGSGNHVHLYYNMTYDLKPGMRRTVDYGRPWNHIRPTEFTITELYDPKIDSRFHKTFRSVWYSNNPDNLPVWESVSGFEPDPGQLGQPKFGVGDTAIWVTNEKWPENTNFDSLYASRPYHYMPINRQGLADFFVNLKFLDPTRTAINSTHGFRDGFLFRLAETYLIAAEAYGRMGDFATAAERLNVVRERAAYKEGERKDVAYWKVYGGDYADRFSSTVEEARVTAADLANEPSFVDFMLDERARELSGEHMRWADLVRTEKLIERTRLHNPNAAVNIQDHHKLRPIPQEHIDRLEPQPTVEEAQNEGYY